MSKTFNPATYTIKASKQRSLFTNQLLVAVEVRLADPLVSADLCEWLLDARRWLWPELWVHCIVAL